MKDLTQAVNQLQSRGLLRERELFKVKPLELKNTSKKPCNTCKKYRVEQRFYRSNIPGIEGLVCNSCWTENAGLYVYVEFANEKLLGEGGFGKVYHGKLVECRVESGTTEYFVTEKSTSVAVKCMRRDKHDSHDSQEAYITNDYMTIYGTVESQYFVYTFMEYIPDEKDFYDVYTDGTKYTLEEKVCQVLELVQQVHYMHENRGHMHCDITIANIMMPTVEIKNGTNRIDVTVPRLMDFGRAASSSCTTVPFGETANSSYLPPELKSVTGKLSSWSPAADIYMLVEPIMYMLIQNTLRGVKYTLFVSHTAMEDFHHNKHNINVKMLVINFLKKMLSDTPNARPSISRVLKFFRALVGYVVGEQTSPHQDCCIAMMICMYYGPNDKDESQWLVDAALCTNEETDVKEIIKIQLACYNLSSKKGAINKIIQTHKSALRMRLTTLERMKKSEAEFPHQSRSDGLIEASDQTFLGRKAYTGTKREYFRGNMRTPYVGESDFVSYDYRQVNFQYPSGIIPALDGQG